MMCQFCCSICGEELKKEEDKKVQHDDVPEVSMCRRVDHPPKTHDKLLGLIVDDDIIQQDVAITVTSADDIIIIDDKTKRG